MLQRGGLLVSGVVYAGIVPRLMGPEAYGRFDLMFSVSVWFFLAGNLGLTQALSRFLPERDAAGDLDGVRAIVGSVLATRLLTGLASAVLYFAGMAAFLPEMPAMGLAALAVAIVVGAAVEPVYALQLGLNRASRWGLSFVVRRWVYLLAIPLGYRAAGLAGAALGVVATELLVLAVGLRVSRSVLSVSHLVLDGAILVPMLRFGAVVFAGGMILATFQLGGEAMVRAVTGDYGEVGFFGLTMGIYLAGEAGILQLGTAFTPFLTRLAIAGRRDELGRWVERLMRGLTVLAMPVVFATLLLGDRVVPVVFGAAFAPAAPNLLPLSVSLVAVVPGAIAGVLGLALTRPGLMLTAAVVRLAVFWGAGFFLVRAHGSLGGSVAVLAGTLGYSAALVLQTQLLQRYELARWGLAVGLALPVVALAWCKGSPARDVALFVVGTGAYYGFLFALRVVTWGEIRATMSAVAGGGSSDARVPPVS